MALKGDFAKLARLQAKLKSLASNDLRVGLANVLGAAALAELQLGFREGRDPYGRAWAPLKLRTGKPLLDTGRMRSSFSYQPSSEGFLIGTNFIGAKVHQHGAVIVPKKAKFLRFKGKISGGTKRGAGGRFVSTRFYFAKKVTIPKRQMVPEKVIGRIWGDALNGAAKRYVSRIMKV